MKRLSFAIMIFVLLMISCKTSSLAIPGEKRVIQNNISLEYFSIASAYEDLKKYDKAIEYYKLALNNKEIKDNAFYKLARCYALSKDWENAEKCYKQILEKDSSNTNIRISLAYIYAMNGNLEAALDCYKTLMDENPNDIGIAKNYCILLISSNNFEEAEKQIEYIKTTFADDNIEKELNSALLNQKEKLKASEENSKKD